MKIAVVVLVGCLGIMTAYAAPEFTTKYDNIDLDKILTSERLLKSYFNCLMERGNCTPDGKELRDILPKAILNECEECNEKQKAGAEKVINYLMEHKADMWDELTKKYDPEGKHKDKYHVEAKVVVTKTEEE